MLRPVRYCLLFSRQGFNEGLFVIYNPSEMLFFPDLVVTICGDLCVWLDKKNTG